MFVAASFCNVAFGQDSADEVKRLLSRAKTAYSMGEYTDALNEYLKVQKMAPNYPDIYKALGDVYGKLVTTNDLREAITNYNKYLELSPNAQDRENILEKIASVEYKTEKQAKQEQILDDLSGLWVSNLNLNNRPYVALKVEEVQQSGKFRVTLLPESSIFRRSIINKTVNIAPEKDNSFRFVLADAVAYNPSASTYDFLRIGISTLGGSNLTQALAQTTVNAIQDLDVPSNTQTAYFFDLKYNEGKLEGLLNTVQKRTTVQTNQTTQDEMLEIVFTKQDMSYRGNFINYIPDEEKPQVLKYDKEAYQLYLKGEKQLKLSTNLMIVGGIASVTGLAVALFGVDYSGDSTDGLKNRPLFFSGIVIAGAGGLALYSSLPILITGNSNQKKAIKLLKKNTQKHTLSDDMKLSFGITPTSVALTLNF